MLEAADGVLVPGGFGSRGWEDPRLPRGARAAGSRTRHLPRHARRRVGVRAARVRARGRQLDGDGSRDAVSRHRPAPRAEGDRGSRRDDAPGRRRWLEPGTSAQETYGQDVIHERHRHRYEVNNGSVPSSSRPASSSPARSSRGGSRWSSCPTIPGSSPVSSTRSSSRGRPGRHRSSAPSSAPRSTVPASGRGRRRGLARRAGSRGRSGRPTRRSARDGRLLCGEAGLHRSRPCAGASTRRRSARRRTPRTVPACPGRATRR